MENRIVGIDLGTSTSEVAYVSEGKPILIPNSIGKIVTPSVIHIGADAEILIGEPAAEFLFTQPDCTFMEVKRMTGSGNSLTAHGKEYTPEQIQSYLLSYLAKCAGDCLGEKISRAVITVPAYFTDIQRRATVKAGELAGLSVERILNEPTAAALDFGLDNLSECKNILVYDFGGGTLDITVLELFEGVIDVKASSGNNHLGGKDFDEALMRYLADPGKDERARMRLKNAAEECKKALSTDDNYRVSLPFLFSPPGGGSGDRDGKGRNSSGRSSFVDKTVSREDFENLIRELVYSSRKPMMSALSDAKLAPKDLDIVLLVGGSTRIPIVRRMVETALSIIPQPFIEPELTVARGAAIQAAMMDGTLKRDLGLVLTDVCPYTLGTSALDRASIFGKVRFDPLIPRNSAIPIDVTKIYLPADDYQTTAQIDAYQGESSDPEKNEFLGKVMLSGIPPKKFGKEPIEVTFSYDMNGILHVRGKVVSTGKEASCVINTTGIEPLKAIDISKWLEAPNAKKHRPLIRKAEKIIAAHTDNANNPNNPEGINGLITELTDLVLELKEAIVKEDEADSIELLKFEIIDMIERTDEYE